MGAAQERGRIRLVRWISVPLAGVVGVSSLAAPAAASAGPQLAAATLANVLSVASNNLSASDCALLSTGQVNCWGYNNSGQLGNGTTKISDVPVVVKNIATATSVIGGDSGGVGGFCARLSTSHVDCWGYGFYGQLGDGTTTSSDVPVAVLASS